MIIARLVRWLVDHRVRPFYEISWYVRRVGDTADMLDTRVQFMENAVERLEREMRRLRCEAGKLRGT